MLGAEPRAGERDGVFYATGYSGHGTQMSVHMGQIMARVMGGDTAANPLAGLDWPARRSARPRQSLPPGPPAPLG